MSCSLQILQSALLRKSHVRPRALARAGDVRPAPCTGTHVLSGASCVLMKLGTMRTSWSVVVRTPRASRAHVSHAARACLQPHAALVLIDFLLEPLHHVLHRILGARAVVPSRVTPPSSIEESAGKLWHPVLRAAPPLVSAGCTRWCTSCGTH